MSAPDRPLASVEDVAAFLGVAPHTIHQWLYKGTAPKSYKIGNRRRFRWADVERWLEAQADDPADGGDGVVVRLADRGGDQGARRGG